MKRAILTVLSILVSATVLAILVMSIAYSCSKSRVVDKGMMTYYGSMTKSVESQLDDECLEKFQGKWIEEGNNNYLFVLEFEKDNLTIKHNDKIEFAGKVESSRSNPNYVKIVNQESSKSLPFYEFEYKNGVLKTYMVVFDTDSMPEYTFVKAN